VEFGIALFSLHRAIRSGLDICSIPGVAAERLGIRILDPTYPLMPIADDEVRRNFKKAADDAGCVIRTVMVGREGDLAAADPAERKQALENHKKWFDRVKELGAIAFRANTGGPKEGFTSDDVKRCAESFAQLAEWGEQFGVKVMIENHGGISSDPDAVLQILKTANSEYLGTAPDFGNFPESVRYEGLAKLMPYAIAVHAKLYEFDERGEEKRFDLPRCMQIVKDAGYRGPLSIEFEGPIGGPGQPADEWEGIAKCKDLLARYGW